MDDSIAEEMLAGEGLHIRSGDPLVDRARALVEEDFGDSAAAPAAIDPPGPHHHPERKPSSDGIVWATGHGSGATGDNA